MKHFFRIKIHPAGTVLFAAAFLFMPSHRALASLAALALHEGVHFAVMMICGMKTCTVELTPFGGMIDERRFDSYNPWKRMFSSGAGIVASAVLTYACISGFFSYTSFAEAFLDANASLTIVNALPLWPLDGARMAVAAASLAGVESSVKCWLSRLTILAGFGLLALGVYGVWNGIVNPTLLVAGPYLWYAARAENVAGKIRRIDEIDRKLCENRLFPVSIWAGSAENIAGHFPVTLGRSENNHFQLLLAIDPATGQIQKSWTEKEMLNVLIEDTRD